MVATDEPITAADVPADAEVPGWRVENGVAIGDGCTMTILEDGRLMLDESGSQIYFVRDGEQPTAETPAAEEPAEAPAQPAAEAPAAEEPAEDPAQSAQGGMLEVKYVCVNAEVSGYTMDASMLGGEYSVIFHEGGALDFVMVGQQMPGMTWTQADNGNFMVDMYGNTLEIVWTEEGFDMNYMDSMLMHFVPEA